MQTERLENEEYIHQLADLHSYIASAVTKADTGSSYGYWDQEDLIQEAYLKIMMNMNKFNGDSKFKTWAYRVAVNRARDMSSRARYTSRLIKRFDAGEQSKTNGVEENIESTEPEPSKRVEIKESIIALLRSLKQSTTIWRGWEVMTLLFKNGGDRKAVAELMSSITGSPWSRHRVNKVVQEVRATIHGEALCESIGI